MGTSIKKRVNKISLEQAVTFKSELLAISNKIDDVRYVKEEHIYYIFTGITWQEVELVSD